MSLCWQVSSILFSMIVSSFDINLSKSLISKSKKPSTSLATMRPAYVWYNQTLDLSRKK